MKAPLSDIHRLPPKPTISRFVAPWDASGWYFVRPNLSVGKPLYSNSNVYITTLAEKYQGSEYIVTFDSIRNGLDDKQEIDFYLEQDATVFVALEQSIPADFLIGFTDTTDKMHTSDRSTYRILAANYIQGSHVHIPGFTGNFHHFIVFVRPVNPPTEGKTFETISTVLPLLPHKKRDYVWYFHEVFNTMPIEQSPAGFTSSGCQVMAYPDSPGRKFVLLRDNAVIKKSLPTSGQEILELSVQIFYGAVSVNFNSVSLLLKNNTVYLNEQSIVQSNHNNFHLRLIRSQIKSNGQDLNPTIRCDIWINNRIAAHIDDVLEKNAQISITAAPTALAALDYLSLRDNPEIFLVQEDFSFLPANITADNPASVSIVNYPFPANKSLRLTDGSCSYSFSPVTDVISLETTVKIETENFTLLPELRDANGQLALRIAMYCNNLYASTGRTWERIFSGSADWMYYPCGNWYHLKISIDLQKGSYNLFIDGAKRAEHYPLINPVNNIAQVGYYAQNSSLYINELRIYDALSICRSLMPPNEIFDIKKMPYNACGNGQSLDTQALQQAINDAAYSGGTVYLHDGIFLTGSLELRSDITLFVAPNAVLVGTQEHSQYPLYTPGNSLCAANQLGRGLIYGQNLCNIRITGGGTLDGQGLYRFKMNDPKTNRTADARPCLIYLAYSNNVTLEDIRMKNSAFWTVVPLSSRNIFMQYLDLNCMNTPNRDGIDPVDCHDMTIRHCNIMAGDDGLCFKSSDSLGCENIDVNNMMIQSLASAIKFGTDSYYSFKNVTMRNCILKNVNRCGISLESVDGADISNIIFEGIDMTDVGAPIYMTIGIRQRLPRRCTLIRQGSIDNVQFRHIRFDKAYPFSFTKNIREVMIIGQNKDQVIRNVIFSDCHFELPGGFSEIPPQPKPIDQKYPEYDQHGLANGYAFCIRYAENIQFHNCQALLNHPDVRPFIGLTDYFL